MSTLMLIQNSTRKQNDGNPPLVKYEKPFHMLCGKKRVYIGEEKSTVRGMNITLVLWDTGSPPTQSDHSSYIHYTLHGALFSESCSLTYHITNIPYHISLKIHTDFFI